MLNTEATEDPAPIGLAKRMKGAGDNGNFKNQACGTICAIASVVGFVFLIMIFSSFNRLTETEQILVKPTTEPWYVLNGPGRHWVWGPLEDERRHPIGRQHTEACAAYLALGPLFWQCGHLVLCAGHRHLHRRRLRIQPRAACAIITPRGRPRGAFAAA